MYNYEVSEYELMNRMNDAFSQYLLIYRLKEKLSFYDEYTKSLNDLNSLQLERKILYGIIYNKWGHIFDYENKKIIDQYGNPMTFIKRDENGNETDITQYVINDVINMKNSWSAKDYRNYKYNIIDPKWADPYKYGLDSKEERQQLDDEDKRIGFCIDQLSIYNYHPEARLKELDKKIANIKSYLDSNKQIFNSLDFEDIKKTKIILAREEKTFTTYSIYTPKSVYHLRNALYGYYFQNINDKHNPIIQFTQKFIDENNIYNKETRDFLNNRITTIKFISIIFDDYLKQNNDLDNITETDIKNYLKNYFASKPQPQGEDD